MFKVFTEGHLDSHHSINQKILSSHTYIVFRNKMFFKSGYEGYMNKPLCRKPIGMEVATLRSVSDPEVEIYG